MKDWELLFESRPKLGRQCVDILQKVWVRSEFLIWDATE